MNEVKLATEAIMNAFKSPYLIKRANLLPLSHVQFEVVDELQGFDARCDESDVFIPDTVLRITYTFQSAADILGTVMYKFKPKVRGSAQAVEPFSSAPALCKIAVTDAERIAADYLREMDIAASPVRSWPLLASIRNGLICVQSKLRVAVVGSVSAGATKKGTLLDILRDLLPLVANTYRVDYLRMEHDIDSTRAGILKFSVGKRGLDSADDTRRVAAGICAAIVDDLEDSDIAGGFRCADHGHVNVTAVDAATFSISYTMAVVL